MRTEKFVTDNIKIGISDYLAMSIERGQVFFHNLKVHDNLQDWMESSDNDVPVHGGHVENYIVPAGNAIEFNLTNLDPSGDFLVEILNSGSPKNYPDFLMENFSGQFPFQNKTLDDMLVTLKITPINGKSTSSSTYNVKVSALNIWPNFKKSCNFHSLPTITVVGAYPISKKLGPVAAWDIFRHTNVRLDISAGFAGGKTKLHKKIIYNVDDKMLHIFPKHFNTSPIDAVDITLTLTIQDPDGIFSIVSKRPISEDPLDNYGDYLELYKPIIETLVSDENEYYELQSEYGRHVNDSIHLDNSVENIYLDKSSFNRKNGNGQSISTLQGTTNYVLRGNGRSYMAASVLGPVVIPAEGY